MATKDTEKKRTTKKTTRSKEQKAAEKVVGTRGRGEARKMAKLKTDGKDVPDAPDLERAVRGNQAQLTITELELRWASIQIVGLTPMLMNEMPMQQILNILMDQMGFKPPKYPRDPYQDCMDAAHICMGVRHWDWRHDNTYGFPAIGLKKSVGTGMYRAKMHKNIVDMLSFLHVHGPYLELGGGKALMPLESHDPVEMLMTPVVIGQGKTSLAFRPLFKNWSLSFYLRFPPSLLKLKDILKGLNAAGELIGIGSWRKEKSGDHGMFTVGDTVEMMSADFQPPRFRENGDWKPPKKRRTIVGERHLHALIKQAEERAERQQKEAEELVAGSIATGKKRAGKKKASK